MIVGEHFAWAHMGKTGGDATAALFGVVSDLVTFAHDPTDRRKHRTFTQFGPEALAKPIKVMNIRRLPGWQLSVLQHRARHGTAEDPTPQPIPPARRTSRRSEADQTLSNYTDDGSIEITFWLRMEHLREDFIRFAQTLRPLSNEEIRRIRSVPTKDPTPYDHDVHSYFKPRHLRRLYRRNPSWTAVEKAVYDERPPGRR